MNNELKHYGILRKSGRYPWGSGSDEYQRSMDFYAYIDGMKAQGIPEREIAVAIGLAAPDDKGFSVADLRSTTTIAKEEIVRHETNRAVSMRDAGNSIQAISDEMGISKSLVRLRIKNSENIKQSSLRATADAIRKEVDEHEIVDIGKGNEHQLGVASTKMRAAIGVLHDEGYLTYTLQVPQVGGAHMTPQKVMVGPGVTFGAARKMIDRIHTMGQWTENEGLNWLGLHTPLSISSKRLKINFAEDGGKDADGIIFVRPGVKDLDMGKNKYAQVRIAIDGTHFIKGVAVLKDDLPTGVDLVFNTNKSKSDPKIVSEGKLGALKEMKRNPDGTFATDNPFGSVIKRQIVTVGSDGKEKVTSAMNILREEGDWEGWSNSLPSQFLSKQPHSFIKTQLDVTKDKMDARLTEIESITNAVVRKKALEDFADQVESNAVDLRAAAMPRQKTAVIVPVPNLKKGEVYAPRFETGERVILVRYPHGGRFEIPEVTVNNNSRTAKKLIGDAPDAIGIHPDIAARLSGADFDGDSNGN